MSKTLINGADGVANWLDINFHCFIFSDDWNDMPCSSLFLLSGNFSRIYRPLIFVYLYTYSINSETNCEIPCKKKPEKAWRAKKSPELLAFLAFPCFFTSKSLEKAGKARKFVVFLESLQWYSKKSLESQEKTLGIQGKPGIWPQ